MFWQQLDTKTDQFLKCYEIPNKKCLSLLTTRYKIRIPSYDDDDADNGERAYELLNYARKQWPALDASITEFRVEVADIRRPPNYHGAT